MRKLLCFYVTNIVKVKAEIAAKFGIAEIRTPQYKCLKMVKRGYSTFSV
jgi:hypothetical protein